MNKIFKTLIRILLILIAVFLFFAFINYECNVALRKYIESFDAVEYGDGRLVPTYEDGFYTFTSDETLDIMYVSDVHLGGGFWTFRNDKKSIYELITMLTEEKPDLVVLGGDNTYTTIGFICNGGFTFNNKMVAKTFMKIFDHEQVYYTTIFGNHDAEYSNYYSRSEIGKIYEEYGGEYCIYESQFSDEEAKYPSVTNQFIIIKNSDGSIRKLLLMIDSNSYFNDTVVGMATSNYDVIHEVQITWAKGVIEKLSEKEGLPEGEYIKTLAFMHIPTGEFVKAKQLIESGSDSGEASLLDGNWNEEVYCGGNRLEDIEPTDRDMFFETFSDEMKCLQGIFVGHDHINNATVTYKGVILSYNFSMDNLAYGPRFCRYGRQRGAMVINLNPDGSFSGKHKNAYTDYHCDTDKFKHVILDRDFEHILLFF